jgi:hypothetical protein
MDNNRVKTVYDFTEFCAKVLEIKNKPKVYLTEDNSWALQRRSFGEYNPSSNAITVYSKNRNMADILRTLAHEMIHHKQNENGVLKPGSGKTGSKIENQANSMAGVILREYGKMKEVIYETIKEKNKNTQLWLHQR